MLKSVATMWNPPRGSRTICGSRTPFSPPSHVNAGLPAGRESSMHAVAAQREVQLFVGGIAFLADEMHEQIGLVSMLMMLLEIP